MGTSYHAFCYNDGVDQAFSRAKKRLIGACAVIAAGLAVAGTLDRATGGVILLAGWALAIAALHRIGRAGAA